MKTLIATLLLAAGLEFTAPAATPFYSSQRAASAADASWPAALTFPSAANTQIRLVSLCWRSDSNAAIVSLSTASNAYVMAITNRSATDTTQMVASTAGMITNSLLIMEQGGVCYTNTLVATNSATNAITISGWGVIGAVGSSIYQMGTATTISSGWTTNTCLDGEAIYVAEPGRPLRITVSPVSVSNIIFKAVARYE